MNEETKAADLAQRVADLEKERNNTAAHVAMIARQLGDEALQVDDIAVRVLALVAERDEAQQARRDAQELAERYQAERNAAGVQARREVAEQIRALTADRDKWRNDAAKLLAHSDAQIETAQASFQERLTLDRANRLLTADRNELRRQLAELERQEPVAWAPSCANAEFAESVRGYGQQLTVWFDRHALEHPGRGHCQTPLYARPVQAMPPIEAVAAEVHQAWIDAKHTQGIVSRPAADGTEQMVPYRDLPDHLRELDRATVRAVYAAIERANNGSKA